MPLSNSEARHVLVVYDGSSAARAALACAGALIDEHQSMVTVITLVVHDRRSVGCCVPAATWNRELDLLAEEQLEEARGLLGSHGRSRRFVAVQGGAREVSRTAAALGCDVVLVPASRLSGERFARACRRTGSPPVVAVKPWDARARAPRPRFHLDHLFTRHRLSAYVGGDLRADGRPRVRRHIEECEDCGRVERSLRRLLGELRLLGGRRPPHLVDAAIDRVRSAERSAEHAGRR